MLAGFVQCAAEGMGFRGRVGFAGRGGFRGGRGGFFQPGLAGSRSPAPPAAAAGASNGATDEPAKEGASTEDATAEFAEGSKWSDEPTPAEIQSGSSPAPAAAPVEGKKAEDKKEAAVAPAAAAKQNGTPALTAAQKGKGVSGRIVPKGATMSWAQIAKYVLHSSPPLSHTLHSVSLLWLGRGTQCLTFCLCLRSLALRPQEKPKPAPVPTPAPAAAVPTKSWDGPSLSDEAVTTSVPKASGDASWGNIPQPAKDVQDEIAAVVDEVKEDVEVIPAEEPVAAPQEAAVEEKEPAPSSTLSSAPPPGLEEPTPSAPAPAAAASAPKKTLPKSQSSRFRSIGDEAVVMPGGVGSGVGKVGMQFGSLSIGGDGEFYQQEESAYVPFPFPSFLSCLGRFHSD